MLPLRSGSSGVLLRDVARTGRLDRRAAGYRRVRRRNEKPGRRRRKPAGISTGAVPPTSTAVHTASRIPIGKGGQSQSRGGRQIAPLMGGYRENDRRPDERANLSWSIRDRAVRLCHRQPLHPMAVDRTLQEIIWLVHPGAVEGVDYDPKRSSGSGKVTTDQDLQIIEDNQRA